MSARPPQLDASALSAALGGGRAPLTTTREGRVRLIGEAAAALMAGRAPSKEAALFLGGALAAWLDNGGNLERDYLQVVKAKSRHTPAFIWQQMASHLDERQDEEEGK